MIAEPIPTASYPACQAIPPKLLHELRTPLNHIIGYTELLLEQAAEQGREEFVPDLHKTHQAGLRLLRLLDESSLAAHAVRVPPESPLAASPSPLADVSHDGVGALGGHLLVVDDLEANRDVLSRRLERQGYRVTSAENGASALASLRAEAFDLVLLDIMMPEMDGFEVLQRLKADPAMSHLPVIMISAVGELDSVVRCIELGAQDYLLKPFNPILLKARISACLEKKRAHDREQELFAQLQESHHALQKLSKSRDDLTHMIIHDLRTPLNAISLALHGLREMGELNAEQQEMLGFAEGGGKNLLGIVNELLEISKMEEGSLTLDRQVLAPADLVAAAVQQIAPLLKARNLELAIDVSSALPPLAADEGKLVRTLVNLLGNAIKFTPPKGLVGISARIADGEQALRFAVSDTGEGIPPESFSTIFEKFAQVASRSGGRTMSTGLGLTFCKLAVEAHGGQIGVESSSSCGSTFYFTIPLLAPPVAVDAATQ